MLNFKDSIIDQIAKSTVVVDYKCIDSTVISASQVMRQCRG